MAGTRWLKFKQAEPPSLPLDPGHLMCLVEGGLEKAVSPHPFQNDIQHALNMANPH